MSGDFDAFVLFAEMRTGSNLLEELLNSVDGVTSLGEVFNPGFIGDHQGTELFGFDLDRREADPVGLIEAILDRAPGLPGFRFFHDHDARVLPRILPDRRIAKIVLTRNPLDSYISRKIAQMTGQWRLRDARARKAVSVTFDADEFDQMLTAWTAFRADLQSALQRSGQTAYFLTYDDVQSAPVVNGLLAYLGIDGAIDPDSTRLKPQNPGHPEDKVANPDDMVAALTALDPFRLDRDGGPPARPRADGHRNFVALADAGLMFMPMPGAMRREVMNWMADAAGCDPGALLKGQTRRALNRWMRRHPGHRKFTVLRHPLARAHAVFCQDILPIGKPRFALARRILRNRYKVPLPGQDADGGYDIAAHRAAFLGFLDFLASNLAGQTSLTVEARWGLQLDALKGMTGFAPPDCLLREDSLDVALPALARSAGLASAPAPASRPDEPWPLSAIHDAEIEAAARRAYARDYEVFGFSDWTAG